VVAWVVVVAPVLLVSPDVESPVDVPVLVSLVLLVSPEVDSPVVSEVDSPEVEVSPVLVVDSPAVVSPVLVS